MRRSDRFRASICCRQPGSTKTSSIAASMFRCCGCGANWRQTRRCRVSSRPNAASAMSLQFLSNKAVWRISTGSRKIAHGQGKPLHACVRTRRFELLRNNLGSGRPADPCTSCKFASSSVATAESLNLSNGWLSHHSDAASWEERQFGNNRVFSSPLGWPRQAMFRPGAPRLYIRPLRKLQFDPNMRVFQSQGSPHATSTRIFRGRLAQGGVVGVVATFDPGGRPWPLPTRRSSRFASDTDELPDRTPARFIHGDALTFTVNSLTVVLREFRCQSPVG